MVNEKRLEAVLADPKRTIRVRKMLQSLGRTGSIPIPSDEDLKDLRAVISFWNVYYAITPDEVFIWGYDGKSFFSHNWNRFKEAALKF